ncbi:MAG: hypothetical protein OEV59_01530 [Deltaproteobacteria bacterium]|nr:hypothetical protein [Deltaproteobacteria bacterium]
MQATQDPIEQQDLFYLAVRPVSAEPAIVETRLDELANLTGLNKADIKHRLTGTSPRVLHTATDGKELARIASALRSNKYPAVVIHKREIKAGPAPIAAKSMKDEGGVISLLDINGKTLLSLDKTSRCVVALTAKKIEDLRQARFMAVTSRGKASISEEDLLRFIFAMHPVMTIFTAGSDTPIEIDSTRFNFTSLEGENKGAASQNFPVILGKIKSRVALLLLDTGFGATSLPFLPDETIKSFPLYSRFIFLCAKGGLFAEIKSTVEIKGQSHIAALGGLFMIGPLVTGKMDAKTAQQQPIPGSASIAEKITAQQGAAPQTAAAGGAMEAAVAILPEAVIVERPGIFSLKGYVLSRAPWAAPFMRSTWYALWSAINISIATLSLAIAFQGEEPAIALPGVISLGLLMFSHSLVLMKRKRDFENCPTSKIGTMPMGEVEVQGTARMRYLLKAPFSLVECVHFRYEVYKVVRSNKSTREVLVESGYSGNVPFIIEDESGTTQVLPKGALLHAGFKSTYSGSQYQQLLAARMITGDKIVETIVTPGTNLYVKGYAHRRKSSAEEKTKKRLAKLQELKADPMKMAKFDKDNDGKLNSSEWDTAVKHLDDELMAEVMKEGSAKDAVAIGEHPSGGLFYISDKSEEELLSSMKFKIPVLLGGGILLTSTGIFFIVQLGIAQEIAKYIMEFFR